MPSSQESIPGNGAGNICMERGFGTRNGTGANSIMPELSARNGAGANFIILELSARNGAGANFSTLKLSARNGAGANSITLELSAHNGTACGISCAGQHKAVLRHAALAWASLSFPSRDAPVDPSHFSEFGRMTLLWY
jgi:hypothetical protein